jgi:hypothetical protein
MLLIRAGLSEVDADALLDQLEAEQMAGHLEDQGTALKFIERQLAEVMHSQQTSPGRMESLLTQLLTGLGLTAFVEYFKALSEGDPPSTATASAPLPSEGHRVNDQAVQARFAEQGFKLIGTGAIGDALQGLGVSLSADGNTAIIGGRGDSNFTGAVWVYTRRGGLWDEQTKLVASDSVGGSLQGSSVSLSRDGDTALVGGPGDNRGPQGPFGAAWVYTRIGGLWRQQAKLVGTPVLGTYAVQGASVSLSGDGNTAIIGGPFDNGPEGPLGCSCARSECGASRRN